MSSPSGYLHGCKQTRLHLRLSQVPSGSTKPRYPHLLYFGAHYQAVRMPYDIAIVAWRNCCEFQSGTKTKINTPSLGRTLNRVIFCCRFLRNGPQSSGRGRQLRLPIVNLRCKRSELSVVYKWYGGSQRSRHEPSDFARKWVSASPAQGHEQLASCVPLGGFLST